jgi:hypothetical protein
MTAFAHYRAEGLDPIVAIADDGRLLATIGEVALGWRLAPVGAEGEQGGLAPAIRVELGDEGWTCSGASYSEPATFTDPVTTACSLIAGLYKAHTFQDRTGLFLHAAGVRVGSGLVLLTGHYRSGKSIVTAACAAAGMQVFSDDIIPLDPGGRVARAPGLAIRLRLPLPGTLSAVTRSFIEAHRIASSQRYAYVRPPQALLARHGEAAPIRAVVAIRREERAPARLIRLSAGDALRETILRNFARETPAGRILDAFDGLTANVPCLTLSYDRAEDAAALIREAFSGRELRVAAPATPAAIAGSSAARGRAEAALPATTLVCRAPGVRARERDGQAFLTDSAEQVIFNLNPTGAAVWRLIERPAEFGDIVETFAAAFPDRDAAAIAVDLSGLMRELSDGGLVDLGQGAGG